MRTHSIILASVLSLAACGKKDAPATTDIPNDKPAAKPTAAEPATPAPTPAAAAAPPGAVAWVKLAPFPLQLQAADATVTDQSMGDIKTVGVNAGTAMFAVGLVTPEIHMTMEQAIKGGESNGGGKNTAKEKLADGYHVETTSESGMIQISFRRTIGGKEYDCGSLAPDADTANIIRTACATLKAL